MTVLVVTTLPKVALKILSTNTFLTQLAKFIVNFGYTTKDTSTASLSDLPRPQTYDNFTVLTQEDIKYNENQLNSKLCGSRHISTLMTKQLIEQLATKIVNLSL